MRCVFTLSGSSREYSEMARVLVLSAREYTNLELICVYDADDEGFVHWLKRHDVRVLRWRITFWDDLVERYSGEKTLEFCRGTYLCMEIPRILETFNIADRIILYVDVDMMFRGCVKDLNVLEPDYFAAPADWDFNDLTRFSTGVIVMNIPSLLEHYANFLQHLRKYNYDFGFAGMGPCDQGAWNTYWGTNYESLNPIYDWKPWWGFSKDARILHFSGPKPHHVNRILKEGEYNEIDPIHSFVINEDPDAYYKYLNEWKEILLKN